MKVNETERNKSHSDSIWQYISVPVNNKEKKKRDTLP